MAPTHDHLLSLSNAAVNLILAHTALLQRLETSHLLSCLHCFHRPPPSGYAPCQPPWPTQSPPTTQYTASHSQWQANKHPWSDAQHDYAACTNTCFHHGGSCYAHADQNLGVPCYEANNFITLAPEIVLPSAADNYLDCPSATALPPTDAQNMVPTTVSQNCGVPYCEANNYFGSVDSVPLPASNHPDCHVATAFSPADAQTISPIEDTARDIYPIKVITGGAASTTPPSYGCQPPPGSVLRHGVTVARTAETLASVSAAATPCLNIDHLEKIYEPAPAPSPASPSFNSDTDLPPLQSSTDEDLQNEPTWSTTFASPNMFDPLQPRATLPTETAAPLTTDTLFLNSVLPGFTVVRRADDSIKSSAICFPKATCAVKAYRRRRLASVQKHPRRYGRKKNARYCRSMPSSPTVVLPYTRASPPTNPWTCSTSDISNEVIGSDSSTASRVLLGAFWASESDDTTHHPSSPQQQRLLYALHTSATTVQEDLDWLEDYGFDDAASSANFETTKVFYGYYNNSVSALYCPSDDSNWLEGDRVPVHLKTGPFYSTKVCYDYQSVTVSFCYSYTSPQEVAPKILKAYDPTHGRFHYYNQMLGASSWSPLFNTGATL